jgi:hypothetical protein
MGVSNVATKVVSTAPKKTQVIETILIIIKYVESSCGSLPALHRAANTQHKSQVESSINGLFPLGVWDVSPLERSGSLSESVLDVILISGVSDFLKARRAGRYYH